jgi:uncharacterized protein Yka (UPF0111/DUF47 family)
MDMQDLLMDIRERVVRIETVLEGHVEDDKKVAQKVEKHEKEIDRAKTSVKVLRWVIYTGFVIIPATVAAMLKILRP